MASGHSDHADIPATYPLWKTDNSNGQNSYTFDQDPVYSTDELFNTDDITSLVPEANIVNSVLKNSLSKSDDITAGGSVIINRRLNSEGRNITFRGRYNYTNSSSEQFSLSETEYFQQTDEERFERLNRYINTPTKNSEYNARLTYSEPIFKGGFYNSDTTSSIATLPPTVLLTTCPKSGPLTATLPEEHSIPT